MVKNNNLIAIIIILILSNFLFIFFIYQKNKPLNYSETKYLSELLTKNYPDFLKKISNKTLENRISFYESKKVFTSNDIKMLWKLLWIKKDFYKNDYLTEKQRFNLIDKIALFKTNFFNLRFLQINLLKYKLGINNNSELIEYLNSEKEKYTICNNNNFIEEQKYWDNIWESGASFDIIHFCEFNYNAEKEELLNNLLENNPSDPNREHVIEHGINDVPVYVNNCSKAMNGNEEYHCLYFK